LLVEFTDKELDIKYRTDKKEEKLGKGGFGSVYKSYDLWNPDKGHFALKVLLFKDQKKDKLMREVTLGMKFDHENIVKYNAYKKTEECLYILMECHGISLWEYMEKQP